MSALRRLRKTALWTGFAILLLVTMYVGAYARTVSSLAGADMVLSDSGGIRMQISVHPVYSLPWPIPAHFNQPWLGQKLKSWFVPVHQLDRRLRPDVWPDDLAKEHDEQLQRQNERMMKLFLPDRPSRECECVRRWPAARVVQSLAWYRLVPNRHAGRMVPH